MKQSEMKKQSHSYEKIASNFSTTFIIFVTTFSGLGLLNAQGITKIFEKN